MTTLQLLNIDRVDIWKVVVASIGFFSLYTVLRIGRRPKNCFPGPPTIPILGNIHQLPKKNLHLQYQKWAEQYGPIFSIQLGQQTQIILTTGNAIKMLVDKRSGNYAERPALYMQDIWEGSRIIMRGYDDLWKVERKLYHSKLNINAAKRYIPYQDLETKQLCFDLLADPKNYVQLIGRTTTSLAASMSYGFRVPSPDSEVMRELFRNAHGFFKMVYNSKFLDWYPSLRPIVSILPNFLYPFRAAATAVYHAEREHFKNLFGKSKDVDVLPSFSADIKAAQIEWKGTKAGHLLTDQAAHYIAGIAFEGGSDTTRNTLIGFIKAMMLFPEVQSKARKELDSIVGTERLPDLNDFDSLPYIRCISKEALRWMPTAISGAIPHASRERDEVDGYTIPAGATVVLAVWAANNDPNVYKNPREFEPLRHNPSMSFLEAATTKDAKNRDMWTFGAGRRICPGLHVAERSLFLAIARILWAFDIKSALDEEGKPIHVDRDEVTQSIAACPLPFPCRIDPRDANRAKVIRNEWRIALNTLDDKLNYKERYF